MTHIKQVLVYRRDLKMRKGKIAAQVAHASMKVLLDRAVERDAATGRVTLELERDVFAWSQSRFTKIVLSVADEAALLEIHEAALEHGLPTALITDAGKTEFGGQPTRTTVAVGPAEAALIDVITGPDGVVETKLA